MGSPSSPTSAPFETKEVAELHSHYQRKIGELENKLTNTRRTKFQLVQESKAEIGRLKRALAKLGVNRLADVISNDQDIEDVILRDQNNRAAKLHTRARTSSIDVTSKTT